MTSEENGEMIEADAPENFDAAAHADDEAPILERRSGAENNRHKRAIFGVPMQVVVSVGRATPSIGELLNMRRDALLPLDSKLDDPVDIMVGKRVIARGELQEVEGEEGRLGVRLTEIVDLSEPF